MDSEQTVISKAEVNNLGENLAPVSFGPPKISPGISVARRPRLREALDTTSWRVLTLGIEEMASRYET
jgi:hypothetical protein